MTTKEDIESYLIRMGVEHEELSDGLWLLKGQPGSAPVVLNYTPPVVLLRLKVMDLPTDLDSAKMSAFYRRLLEINASDIVHGSYGIEESNVVISDALQLEDLDFSELRSSYESILLAASSHTPVLAELIPVAHEG
ncbi:MAG TPA: YbjN domain-containing protein [Longimicrobiales bacterium]|nr:YbjN domain-containing protein [Longimicrobiales bacterium]